MSSPLDTAVLFGKESTYGTPATLTHAVEAKSDPWARSQEYVESLGFRAGSHGVRTDRRKVVNMGAAGSIEADMLDRGFGFLLEGLLDATTGPTAGTGSEFTSTHASDTDAAGLSYTVQVLRPVVDGGIQPFTYHGAVPTGWSLSHDVGGLLVLSADFDAEDEDTDTPAGTPVYPADAEPFSWVEGSLTLDGSPVDPSAFSLTADLGMKTDRRFIRANPLKKQPKRITAPTYEGSLSVEFDSLDIYNAFTAGTIMPLEATWATGPGFSVVLTLAAVQFTGSSPSANLDDLTLQEAPFKVLHNGSDPMVSIVLTNEDSAF